MTNSTLVRKTTWTDVVRDLEFRRGWLSVIRKEPFDYDKATWAYERGRQVATLTSYRGPLLSAGKIAPELARDLLPAWRDKVIL